MTGGDHWLKEARQEFRERFAEIDKLGYPDPDTLFGYRRRKLMQFALNKWEPKVFKAETQAAAVAIVSVIGWAFDMPVEVTGALSVVVGYAVGYVTVKNDG